MTCWFCDPNKKPAQKYPFKPLPEDVVREETIKHLMGSPSEIIRVIILERDHYKRMVENGRKRAVENILAADKDV